MKIREVYLLNGESLSDSQTVIVNLTRGLKILSLRVQYKNTNGATSNTLGRLNSMVSKLQVLDGSTVLHSLSMREEQALNFYMRGRLPFQALTRVGGKDVTEECYIDFWRGLGDMQWYLDTANFNNPQLQLTHDFTISATAGFATGDGVLSVIATVIDSGAPSRLGFLMAKELDSFSSTASGDHTTDLPLDFPIASVLVQNPVNGDAPDATLSNLKLTADTDAFIPVNESYGDLLKGNLGRFGRAEQSVDLESASSWTDDSDVYESADAFTVQSAAPGPITTSMAGNEATVALVTGSTAQTGRLHYRGSAPHSSVIYPFGDGMTPDQIFSPQGVGKFQLKLTNAGTGATPKVVTVQQHP